MVWVVMVGTICPPPVGIGLTDLPNIGGASGPPAHIVRKAGKKFKKSRKLDVLDLYEIDKGGPYAPFYQKL